MSRRGGHDRYRPVVAKRTAAPYKPSAARPDMITVDVSPDRVARLDCRHSVFWKTCTACSASKR